MNLKNILPIKFRVRRKGTKWPFSAISVTANFAREGKILGAVVDYEEQELYGQQKDHKLWYTMHQFEAHSVLI